jgi:hypothetical protein
MKPWFKTNIDVTNALVKNFNTDQYLKQVPPGQSFHLCRFTVNNLENIVQKSWVNYMNTLGITVSGVQLFYTKSYAVSGKAHVDNTPNTPASAAFNWCIGPDSADMVWYALPDYIPEVSKTPADTTYTAWPLQELTFQSRQRIGNTCTMVRIDIPHHIFIGGDDRWCISVRTKNKFDQWADIVNTYEHIIKC